MNSRLAKMLPLPLALATLAIVPAPASAAYQFALAWGSHGTASGEFDGPRDVAIDRSRGHVYVADSSNLERIQEFKTNGKFIRLWGTSGSGPGEFDFLTGLAVSPSGNVYAVDRGNNRVEKFTASGDYLYHVDHDLSNPADAAVNSSTGDVYVTSDGNDKVVEFSSSGSFIREWGGGGTNSGQFSDPGGIAVDNSGDVYVGDDSGRIQKFTSHGHFIDSWGPYYFGPNNVLESLVPASVSVGPTGGVFVSSNDWQHNITRIVKFTATGQFVTQFGSFGSGNGQFDGLDGIDLDSAGNVYAADYWNYRIERFNAVGPQTTITSHPSLFTNDSTPTFNFTSSEANSKFECKLGMGDASGVSFAPCAPPTTYPPETDGSYTFEARAIDSAGLRDLSPAKYSFTIDTVPPDTTITSGPANGAVINDATPTFGFTSSESGSTFACKHDSGDWSGCTSPHATAHLSDGQHTWYVRAKDKAGNRDPSPASRTFTVDTTAAVDISSDPVTLTQAGIARVDVTCPASEASGGCGGTLTLRTHNQVTYNGETRKFNLGSANFLMHTGDTSTLKIQLASSKQQLVAENSPLSTDAIADVTDALGNTGISTQTFNLSAP